MDEGADMPPSAESSAHERLTQACELCSSALAQASMVKTFVGRWMVIRNRMERLSPCLAQLADSLACVKGITMCMELIQAIISSLQEATQLASKCISQDYGGKLQMQSSLDALSMKLGLHLEDIELLVRSGILRESCPSIVYRGRSRINREAVKWSVKDFLARLQIGGPESKQKPLDSLVELMQEDDKNALVVSSQGGIPVLVHLLDSCVIAIREKAAAAVCHLCHADSCKQLLVKEGGLAPLVRLLDSASPVAKEEAAAAIQALTFSPENAKSVAAQGAIPLLIDICQNGRLVAQAAAAGVLRNLSTMPELRPTLAEEGIIHVMIGLVVSGTTMAQEYAADVLQNMASSDNEFRYFIVRDSSIQALLRYFDTATTIRGQEVAMGALENIATSGANIEGLISAGFLSRLIAALKSGQCMLQLAAVSAVCHIARSMELRKLLGEAGCIPPLVGMLGSKTSAAQEMVSQALFSLILVEQNKREIRKDEKCILGMVQLLDPTNQNVTKKFPVSVLLCLSCNKKCRKWMVSAGACTYLKILASMDVTGAKKLLERLERSGRWGFFRV